MKFKSVVIVHGSLETFGGAEKIIYQLAEDLIKKGIRLDIITYSVSKKIKAQFEQVNCKIITLDIPLININDTKWFSLMYLGWKIRGMLVGYDVINVHNFPATIWLGYASKFGKYRIPPIVWSCHEPPRSLYDNYGLNRTKKLDSLIKLDFKSVMGFKSIVCNSYFTESCVKKYYKKDAKVKHFGISIDSKIINSKVVKPEEIVFGTVSRLEFVKNIDFILKSLAKFKQSYPEIKFRYEIVGVGADEARLLNLVDKLDLQDSVSFLGFVSNDIIIDCYKRWKFVVYCPFNEPMGLIPLEAAQYNTPTIGSNQGGVLETVLNKKTGLLVDPLNIDALVKALKCLIEDSAYCRKLGEASLKHVIKNFNFKLTVDFMLQEFNFAVLES